MASYFEQTNEHSGPSETYREPVNYYKRVNADEVNNIKSRLFCFHIIIFIVSNLTSILFLFITRRNFNELLMQVLILLFVVFVFNFLSGLNRFNLIMLIIYTFIVILATYKNDTLTCYTDLFISLVLCMIMILVLCIFNNIITIIFCINSICIVYIFLVSFKSHIDNTIEFKPIKFDALFCLLKCFVFLVVVFLIISTIQFIEVSTDSSFMITPSDLERKDTYKCNKSHACVCSNIHNHNHDMTDPWIRNMERGTKFQLFLVSMKMVAWLFVYVSPFVIILVALIYIIGYTGLINHALSVCCFIIMILLITCAANIIYYRLVIKGYNFNSGYSIYSDSRILCICGLINQNHLMIYSTLMILSIFFVILIFMTTNPLSAMLGKLYNKFFMKAELKESRSFLVCDLL